MNKLNIGVLSLQGAVREHIQMIENSGAHGVSIKKPHELSKIDALIIPGGESTVIGKLMAKYGFDDAIKELYKDGMPIYGTCAGLILLAQKVVGGNKYTLGLMNIEVRRNAFGRQKESFEADLEIPGIGKNPFTGIFIRAPWIELIGKDVHVMAKFKGKIVMAQEGRLLVTAFHPELTGDKRIHDYFIEMVKKS